MAKDLTKYDDGKLKKMISTLEDIDPDSEELKEYRAELGRRSKKVVPEMSAEGIFETDMDEEELAGVKTGFSNRPTVGEYSAILGKPDKNYSDSAIKVPFTIIEDGQWKGFGEDAFYPGKSKEAAFSMKNICVSAHIEPQKNPKTGRMFWPIAELEGRKIIVVYKERPGKPWVGNDGIEREGTPQSKVAHAKPYYEKPQTLM